MRARLNIDRAVELTYLTPERVTAGGGDARLVRGRVDTAAAEFDAALTAAAEALGPDGVVVPRRGPGWRQAKNGIVTRMGEIAVDRAHRPGRYQELQRTYVRRKEPPSLMREHVNENCRLAWELLLVMPMSSDASSEFRSRAAEAIGAIGNPDSVTILAHAIDVLAREDVPPTSPGNEAQRRLMAALLRMPPSAAGAEAISTAVTDIRHQQTEHADKGGPRWDAKTYVVDAVVGMPAPARDAWLAVTDHYWPAFGEARARLKQRRALSGPGASRRPSPPAATSAPTTSAAMCSSSITIDLLFRHSHSAGTPSPLRARRCGGSPSPAAASPPQLC